MTELQPVLPTEQERNLALLSHALSFVEGGVVAPLLLYIFRDQVQQSFAKDGPKEASPFVAFHSLQSLYFGLMFVIISLPVAVATCGWGLFITAPLYLVFELIACIKAHAGLWYSLPIAGPLAARVHPPPWDARFE